MANIRIMGVGFPLGLHHSEGGDRKWEARARESTPSTVHAMNCELDIVEAGTI